MHEVPVARAKAAGQTARKPKVVKRKSPEVLERCERQQAKGKSRACARESRMTRPAGCKEAGRSRLSKDAPELAAWWREREQDQLNQIAHQEPDHKDQAGQGQNASARSRMQDAKVERVPKRKLVGGGVQTGEQKRCFLRKAIISLSKQEKLGKVSCLPSESSCRKIKYGLQRAGLEIHCRPLMVG